VGPIKSIWAMVQGDPVFMRRVNGWLAVFWIAMIPFSLVMGWLESVVYVSALSLWALVSGHWSAWQAARVEVAQLEAARKREKEDLVADVVAALLAKTNVEPATGSSLQPGMSSGTAVSAWQEDGSEAPRM
jgi:hypothetical protein